MSTEPNRGSATRSGPVEGVIACSSSHALAHSLAQTLGVPLLPALVRLHPDGELDIQVQADVKGMHVALVGTFSSPIHSHLFEYALFADALGRAGVAHVTGVVPYMAYARQDRVDRPGTPLSLAVVGELLRRDELTRIYTVELHNPDSPSVMAVPMVNLRAEKAVAEYLEADVLPETADPVLASPDEGRAEWVDQIGRMLKLPSFHMLKTRSSDRKVEVTSDEKMEGRDVIVLDDMISTGGTMAKAVRLARDGGARSVHCAAVHGVFAEHAETRLFTAGADTLAVSNSIASGFCRIDLSDTLALALREG